VHAKQEQSFFDAMNEFLNFIEFGQKAIEENWKTAEEMIKKAEEIY